MSKTVRYRKLVGTLVRVCMCSKSCQSLLIFVLSSSCTSVSHGVVHYFPGLWGSGISVLFSCFALLVAIPVVVVHTCAVYVFILFIVENLSCKQIFYFLTLN